jgi:hypothetical protein
MTFVGTEKQLLRFLARLAAQGQPAAEVPGTGMHLGRGLWAFAVRLGEPEARPS